MGILWGFIIRPGSSDLEFFCEFFENSIRILCESLGNFKGIFWQFLGTIRGIFWECFGNSVNSLGMSGWGVLNVWVLILGNLT